MSETEVLEANYELREHGGPRSLRKTTRIVTELNTGRSERNAVVRLLIIPAGP